MRVVESARARTDPRAAIIHRQNESALYSVQFVLRATHSSSIPGRAAPYMRCAQRDPRHAGFIPNKTRSLRLAGLEHRLPRVPCNQEPSVLVEAVSLIKTSSSARERRLPSGSTRVGDAQAVRARAWYAAQFAYIHFVQRVRSGVIFGR